MLNDWNTTVIFAVGATIRLILICYGRIQDALFDVKYTDIDYRVFVDAAEHVINGRSPYQRSTYRYTPLIAWLVAPSVRFAEFGKILFVLFDLLNAYLIYKMCKLNASKYFDVAIATALFNPLTMIISSRGNAESLVSFNVLIILYFLQTDRLILAAMFHGLSVHVKLYPVIYLPSVYFYFMSKKPMTSKKDAFFALFFNFNGILYLLITMITFSTVTYAMYVLYGRQFLDESILYHFSRSDVKHNFSPYFYVLYLYEYSDWLKWMSLAAFLPQLILIISFSWRFKSDLKCCWFFVTFAFVSLNKVCTSQYFVWYLTFLSFVVAEFSLTLRHWFKVSSLWFGAQGVWLFFAYLLEFRGYNTFLLVWLASLLFLCVNCYLLTVFVGSYANFGRNDIVDNKVKKS